MLRLIRMTSAAEASRTGFANRRFSRPLSTPTPSISGTVPRLKHSIAAAPRSQLPEASA